MHAWRITIEGHGRDYADHPEDAKAGARSFVRELQHRGHDVTGARYEQTTDDGASSSAPESLFSDAAGDATESTDEERKELQYYEHEGHVDPSTPSSR